MFEPDLTPFEVLGTNHPQTSPEIETLIYRLSEVLRPLRQGMMGGRVTPQALCDPFVLRGDSLMERGFRKLFARNPTRARRWLDSAQSISIPRRNWAPLPPPPDPAPPRIHPDALPPRLRLSLEHLARSVERFPRLHRLQTPASEAQLVDAEGDLRRPLPSELRALWRFANGMSLFEGLFCLLSVEDLVQQQKSRPSGESIHAFDIPSHRSTFCREGTDEDGLWRLRPYHETSRKRASEPLARTVGGLLDFLFDQEDVVSGKHLGLRLPRRGTTLPPDS